MAGKLPDDFIRDLHNRGFSQAEIRRKLLVERGIETSSQNISFWMQSRHLSPPSKVTEHHLKLIPWRIATQHQNNKLQRALQAEAKRRTGAKLSSIERGRRDRLYSEYIAGNRFVVHYSREDGWCLVLRRPGIDKDWIREPRILDDGVRIVGSMPGLRSGA